MAKVSSLISVKGVVGDLVFTDGKKMGQVVRKRPKKSKRTKGTAFLEQEKRTAYLNELAANINRIIKDRHDIFKSSSFYSQLISRFRKEPLNNRFLLLHTLIGMEANPVYRFERLGNCKTSIKQQKNRLHLELYTTAHPGKQNEIFDCYSYAPLLFTWTARDPQAIHQQQWSDWIPIDKSKNFCFDFKFVLPKDTVHWMIAIYQVMGTNTVDSDLMAAAGLRFWEVGSLLKSDNELLKQREAKEKERIPAAKKLPDQRVRVKARK